MDFLALPQSTIPQFARRAALGKSWTALIVARDFAEHTSRLKAEFENQGVYAVSTSISGDLRSIYRDRAGSHGKTAVIVVAEYTDAEAWNRLDLDRTALEGGLTVLLTTPDGAAALTRGAPHVASYLSGAMWSNAVETVAQDDLVKTGRTATRPSSGRGDFAESASWIVENRAAYSGWWVALRGGVLVDSDRSRRVLQERLTGHPAIREILVVRVEGNS